MKPSVSIPSRLPCGSRVVDLTQPQVMGILNVTPDSFSDGGTHNNLVAALTHAEAMIQAGASIIDVGGESTRPNAAIVSVQEELDRVAPAVEAINKEFDVVISVDTSTPQVITESARLGAGIINDVRSLQREGALEAAKQTGLPVCIMHMRGEPRDMQQQTQYDDLLVEVKDFLRERSMICQQAGISKEKIIIDPGFGFAKTLQQNLLLFRHMEQLLTLGHPMLVGVSRKSMIGGVLGKEVTERLYGSLALAALAITKGAHILRVHDVAETVDIVKMISAVESAE
ncbi:dihydropteroate synthase [Entomomonas asaccharolytica]|uniref:Dihydropteroate synthase n=1 Tax=Entomomonas asaccharolytica TaxID=2785331 RepID=A0A974NHH2_9GAMM|nr:dihydropteroate synthase [Entomomonas asaccharolytica]QQP86648.1 dihydropteroate synthase [Entomomonas asaccharolytica]